MLRITTLKRASRDSVTVKPWIFPHSGNFRPTRSVIPGTPATRSVGCPDGFLSMIFGFLGKFQIDIEKKLEKSIKKYWSKKNDRKKKVEKKSSIEKNFDRKKKLINKIVIEKNMINKFCRIFLVYFYVLYKLKVYFSGTLFVSKIMIFLTNRP